jgi:DNA repair protein RadC
LAAYVAHALAQGYRALYRVLWRRSPGRLRRRAQAAPAGRIDPYLVGRLSGEPEELLVCLFYDGAGAFKAEQNWQGGRALVGADRRALMGAAVAHDAHYVVIAHNHPSGSRQPSAQDIEATRHIYRLFAALGVTLVDHVIVACDGIPFSFRLAGLI